jgi:hypothetical protein
METVLTPGQHSATIMQVRSYAMVHAAMFDAVNSIDGSHTPYLTDVPGSQNASIEAAAAQAARDVLTALYPTRVGVFDAELAISLQWPTNRSERVSMAVFTLRSTTLPDSRWEEM